jgi:broad specificity phosphatase PhoE
MIHGNLVEGLIERVDGSPQEAEEAVESRREGGHAAASIVYETHSLSTDNDLGFATGWKEGQLSEQGRVLAKELGQRRLHDGIDAVFVSDLGRAVETAKIAFLDSKLPVYFDSRLRECNYGDWNGAPVAKIASTRRATVRGLFLWS